MFATKTVQQIQSTNAKRKKQRQKRILRCKFAIQQQSSLKVTTLNDVYMCVCLRQNGSTDPTRKEKKKQRQKRILRCKFAIQQQSSLKVTTLNDVYVCVCLRQKRFN